MTAQGFTDQGFTTSDNLLAGEFPRIAELATVSGGKYARGTILGKITASGKCTICTSAATDGSRMLTPFWRKRSMHRKKTNRPLFI